MKPEALGSVTAVIARHEPEVKKRLDQNIKEAGLVWPVSDFTFLVSKKEKRLEVWGRDQTSGWKKK